MEIVIIWFEVCIWLYCFKYKCIVFKVLLEEYLFFYDNVYLFCLVREYIWIFLKYKSECDYNSFFCVNLFLGFCCLYVNWFWCVIYCY